MKNFILTLIISVFILLSNNAESSILKIGEMERIGCENIYKRDTGPITYDFCQSLKHSGLSKINYFYNKTITEQINPLPIYNFLPVRFYTEDGLIFHGGFVHLYFKKNKVDFLQGDFIIKFDVDTDVPSIPVSNPDEDDLDNDLDNDYVNVPEPNTLFIFAFAVIILMTIRYNKYK